MNTKRVYLLQAHHYTQNLCGELQGIFTTEQAAKNEGMRLATEKNPDKQFQWEHQGNNPDGNWILYRDVPDSWEPIDEFEIIEMLLNEAENAP